MKVIVAGDFYDGGRVSENLSSDLFQPFGEISPIISEAQFKIVNFEFPIVDSNASPIAKDGPHLSGTEQSIKIIKDAGFNVCTLANNHILDYGPDCCIDTMRKLQNHGISTVGVGSNVEEASNILYLKDSDKTLAVINCCEHEFSIAEFDSPGANPLSPIQQFYQIQEASIHADYVLVIIHGGHEHYQLPSPRMQETYRFYIDAGADVVVNHHQHCFSGYEVYKGKPIFYGLGNFLFDSPNYRNTHWNTGFFVELDFSSKDSISYNLHPYSQCNEYPNVRLMNEPQKKVFYKKIRELNTINGDVHLLTQEYTDWVESTSDHYLMIFQPYMHYILRAMYIRKLLPTFMNKRKKYHILGLLKCQSHFDRLVHMVSKLKTDK